MTRALARAVLARTVLLTASACSLVTAVPDDSAEGPGAGGPGSPTSSRGGGGAGPSTSTGGTGASSASTTGGAGGCAADLTSDPANCGACGWSCGGEVLCVDEVCEPLALTTEGVISGVAVVGDEVVTQLGTTTRVFFLESRPVESPESMWITIDIEALEGGLGLLARTSGLDSAFFYAPQVSPSTEPTFLRCGLFDPGCQQVTLVGPTPSHVTGFVRGANDNPFILLNETAHLSTTDFNACSQTECWLSPASGVMLPPAGESYDPIPFSLDIQESGTGTTFWWTNFTNQFTPACLYRWRELDGNDPVSCAFTLPGPLRVVAAGPNVVFGNTGPTHSVNEQEFETFDGNMNLEWPADVDDELLYAVDASDATPTLVALRLPVDGSVPIARLELPPEHRVTSVDASNENYIFFATTDDSKSVLHRWRKPASK